MMPADEELEGIITRIDREVNPPQVAAADRSRRGRKCPAAALMFL